MADRILVSTSEMEATIGKFEQAHNTLQNAFSFLDKAKDHLDRCYKGPAYIALCAKYVNISLNVRTAERAIEASVNGLRKTIGTMETGEGNVASAASATDTGKGAPTYL